MVVKDLSRSFHPCPKNGVRIEFKDNQKKEKKKRR